MNKAKFYYLDNKNKPQGPFTLEQLAALKISGVIHEKTKVATAGDMEWVALDEQEWMREGEIVVEAAADKLPFASGVGVDPGKCPKCKAALKGWSVPVHCHDCGYQIRPAKDGFMSSMLYTGKRIFSCRGRATRQDYWAFVVGMIPVVLLWMFAIQVISTMIAEETAETQGYAQVLMYIGIFFSVSYAILLVPYFCMYCRRFHDMGLSGWWSGLMVTVMMISTVSVFPCLSYVTENIITRAEALSESVYSELEAKADELEQKMEEAAASGDDTLVNQLVAEYENYVLQQEESLDKEIDNLIENKLEEIVTSGKCVWAFVWLLSTLLSMVCGLVNLIIGIVDSKRGPNRYGPSVKYPRG